MLFIQIVLNKVDQISDEDKAKVLKVIKTLQPEAKIIEATFGDVPVSDILSTESFDYEKILNSPGWLKAMEGEEEDEEEGESEEYGIGFRKDSDVTAKVNELLQAMKADGSLQALADKYSLTLAG